METLKTETENIRPEYEPVRKLIDAMTDGEAAMFALLTAMSVADNCCSEGGKYLTKLFSETVEKCRDAATEIIRKDNPPNQASVTAQWAVIIDGLTG